MLENGIIEISTSDWASPIVSVKKDGSLRLCVDYCQLSSVSQSNAYPIPRVDDLINQIRQAKFISALELTRGYWLLPQINSKLFSNRSPSDRPNKEVGT